MYVNIYFYPLITYKTYLLRFKIHVCIWNLSSLKMESDLPYFHDKTQCIPVMCLCLDEGQTREFCIGKPMFQSIMRLGQATKKEHVHTLNTVV